MGRDGAGSNSCDLFTAALHHGQTLVHLELNALPQCLQVICSVDSSSSIFPLSFIELGNGVVDCWAEA